jgi:hypothetical protein
MERMAALVETVSMWSRKDTCCSNFCTVALLCIAMCFKLLLLMRVLGWEFLFLLIIHLLHTPF